MKNDENTVVVDEEDPQNPPTIGGVRLVNEPVDTSEDQQEQSTPPGWELLEEGTDVDTSEDQQEQSTLPGRIYHMIGIITIIFGIIVGIWMLVEFYNQQTLFSASKSALTFGEVVIAFGAAMMFIVPGAICIGIGQIIKLLDK